MKETEAKELYDNYLDELGIENLGCLPPASVVLKEVDPTAYNCGFADFCSNESVEID